MNESQNEVPYIGTNRYQMLGYGQQPPCAPVAPSRLASRGAQSASVRCAFEPELLKADNTLWKPMVAYGSQGG
jgi:hypothetical protein